MFISSVNSIQKEQKTFSTPEPAASKSQGFEPSALSSKASWKKFQAESTKWNPFSFDESDEDSIQGEVRAQAMHWAGKAFGKWEKGDHQDAIRYLTSALDLIEKKAPGLDLSLNLYHARACLFVETGKMDNAVEDFSAALVQSSASSLERFEHSPAHLKRERALALLLKENPDLSQARIDLEEAAQEGDVVAMLLLKQEENPTPTVLPHPLPQDDDLYELIETLFKEKHFSQAIVTCSQYIDDQVCAPDYILDGVPYTRVLSIRGACYALLGDQEEALDNYDEAVDREMDEYDLLNYLNARALIYFAINDKKEAFRDLKRAKEEALIDSTATLLTELLKRNNFPL